MTDLLSDIATPSDAELISSVRGGDVAAYGELFARHKDAANRLARQLVRGPDADDLVSEAFAKVLSVLQNGGGPDVAFRAYLLTAVRRLHVDKMRAAAKVQTSDDMEVFDPGVPFHDTAVASFESGAAARAFASLPERWQLVLWHLEVEGNKPADIAPLLGMSPNSVSALAYRAREGLRQAFLTMHLNDISETECRWVNEHLGAYVRKGLSNRDSVKVQKHLDGCRRCTAMYLELTEVNSNLAAIIGPLLLGGAAAGYIASAAGGAAGGFGLTAMVGRVRDVVAANAGAATVGGIAASVVAATAVGAMLLPNTPERVVGADRPVTSTVPAPTEGTSKLPQPEEREEREEREPQPADEVTDESSSPSESTTPEAASVPVVLPGADPTTAGPGPAEEPAPAEEPSPEPEPSEEPAPQPQPSEEPAPTSPTDATTPAQPSPAPPTTSEPAPTTEPPPPVTTEPSPSGPPPNPTTPPATPTVRFEGSLVYADGKVAFTLSGEPLPPVVTVEIESTPAGITFDADQSGATCTIESPTAATCPTGSAAGSALLRASAATDTELSDALPLVVPTNHPDSTVEVAVSAVGLEKTTASFEYAGVTDISLDDLTSEWKDGRFHVQTALAGVTGLDYVLLRLDSAADFDASANCTRADAKTLMCYSPTDGPRELVLQAPPGKDTPMTLTVEAPDAWDENEDRLADNTRSTTLLAPRADLAVTAVPRPTGNSGKGFIDATVDTEPGLPTTLDVSFDPDKIKVTWPSDCESGASGNRCTVTGDTTLVFGYELVDRQGNDTVSADFTFRVASPDRVDPNPDNDTARVTVDRHAR